MADTAKDSKKNRKKRIVYLDFLRVFGALAVVVIHVSAVGFYAQPIDTWEWQWVTNTWHSIFRWAVPIFVMISGALNIPHFNCSLPFKQGLKKILIKVMYIYLALIFWTMFYKVIYTSHLKELFKEPLVYLKSLNLHAVILSPNQAISGDSQGHLWFLYLIIGLYLLTPLVKAFVSRCEKVYVEYFLILFFIIGLCVPFYNLINTLKDLPFLPQKIHLGVPESTVYPELSGYLGYFVAGYYFATYEVSKKFRTAIYILGVSSTFLTILGTVLISTKLGHVYWALNAPLRPTTMFATYAVFLFSKNLFEKRNCWSSLKKLLRHLGKYSFGIYLIHIFMIKVLYSVGITWNTFNPILSIPFVSIMVFVLSYVAIVICSKIPLLNKVIL